MSHRALSATFLPQVLNSIFLKIRDGGGRHLENHNNRDISTTDWPISTKFGTVVQNGLLTSPNVKNWISKIQEGGRPPFCKSSNRHISATVRPILPLPCTLACDLDLLTWPRSWQISELVCTIFTARCYASAVLDMDLCPSVSVCVCLSVTSRCSTKTAKRRITKTTPDDTPRDSSFLMPKISAKFDRGHPLRGRRMQVGWSKSATFDK